MASTISHSDSQAKLTENEILIDESTMNDDEEEEEEEATVPKSDDQTLITTPFLPNKESSIPRQLSLLSSSSKTSDYPDICRICHCEGTNDEPLISPCLCLGTMQYLHQSCLQRWIKSAGVKSCELCKFEFIMHSEIKPFKQVDY
jgi:E3 ubiquitin-protein ligase MARCH1/8